MMSVGVRAVGEHHVDFAALKYQRAMDITA
jgi:hypothetical protein